MIAKKFPKLSPGTRATAAFSLLQAALLLPQQAGAQTDEVLTLDEIVVSATRSEHEIHATPSSVSLLALDSLARSGVSDMRDALAREPGVTVVSTGALGGQSSVFTRGASTHQTLFFVDGVRMNDRSASYQNYLGGAGLENIGRLEILRGQQSTLYGSSAMGGVITLNTARGRDQAGGSIHFEAGSFDTYRGTVIAGGTLGRAAYTASVSRIETDNDRPLNAFESWEYSGRIDLAASDNLTLGTTVRGQSSEYEEPGSTFFPSPGVVDQKLILVTAYAEFRPADNIISKLTTGAHRRDYNFESSWGSSPDEDSRDIVDWVTTWGAGQPIEIVAGINHERSKHVINGDTTRDEGLAGFASATVKLNDTFIVTGGARNDHFDSVGGATTWRTGFSWQLAEHTRLRATYGTGFAAPSAADRYGVPAWGQLANPDLEPEESRGWDIGVEQAFNAAGITTSLTYFDNHFDNLFEWETVDFTTFEGTIVNRANASTRGIEAGIAARPHAAVTARLAYTFLRAEDDDTSADLIRRPRHTLDAQVSVVATRRIFAGIGLRLVADRTDSTGPMDDYTTLRAFGRFQISENLVMTARMENLLDETYEEVAGYPALPFAAYAGLDFRF